MELQVSTAPSSPAPSQDAAPRRRRRRPATKEWLEKKRLKYDYMAEGALVVATRDDMLRCWACVDDETGAEIERHLRALSDEYAERVAQVAWGMNEAGELARDWRSMRARAIATVMIFLAYNALPAELHGEQAYRVAGYTMGFYRMLCGRWVLQRGKHVRRLPTRGTFGHLSRKKDSDADGRGWMGELRDSGLAKAFQFDANKVSESHRTKLRFNPKTGKWEQWAFNQLFTTIRPWKPGLHGPGNLEPRATKKKFAVRSGMSLMERLLRKRDAERKRVEQDLINPSPAEPPPTAAAPPAVYERPREPSEAPIWSSEVKEAQQQAVAGEGDNSKAARFLQDLHNRPTPEMPFAERMRLKRQAELKREEDERRAERDAALRRASNTAPVGVPEEAAETYERILSGEDDSSEARFLRQLLSRAKRGPPS